MSVAVIDRNDVPSGCEHSYDTTLDSGPQGTTNDSTPAFTFSSSTNRSFECSMDGSPFADCSSPFQAGALNDGRSWKSQVLGAGLHAQIAEGNQVVVKTTQVTRVTVWLGRDSVDFTKPVTIRVNGSLGVPSSQRRAWPVMCSQVPSGVPSVNSRHNPKPRLNPQCAFIARRTWLDEERHHAAESRVEEAVAEPHQRGEHDDRPETQMAGCVHGGKRGDRREPREVGKDHHPPARRPVGERAADQQSREEPARLAEEHDPEAAGANERERPPAERREEGRVSDQGDRLPCEEQPEVAIGECLEDPHAAEPLHFGKAILGSCPT